MLKDRILERKKQCKNTFTIGNINSCLNLITDDTLNKRNIAWNNTDHTALKSAGDNNYFQTLGSTTLDTLIHGHQYNLKFHVVKQADIPINMILGKNFSKYRNSDQKQYYH